MADSGRHERERSPRREKDSHRRRRQRSPNERGYRNRSRSPSTRSEKGSSRRFENERRGERFSNEEQGTSRLDEDRRRSRHSDEWGLSKRSRDERRRDGESSRFEGEQRHVIARDEQGRRERSRDESRRSEGSSSQHEEKQRHSRACDEQGGRERHGNERRRDRREERQGGRMDADSRSRNSEEDIESGKHVSGQRPKGGGAKARSKWTRGDEEDYSQYEFGRGDDNTSGNEESSTQSKEKANFGHSGKLTAETNTYKGVVIKYSEPPEARQPKTRWRLYQFKGEECINTLYIHRQSAYLIGRERHIVDFAVDHPSCSKQHAVLQYRLVDYTKEDGRKGRRVRPYIIDLESTNGTFLNNNKIEPSRYVELKERDVLKFGFSTREYVLLHENSKGDEDEMVLK